MAVKLDQDAGARRYDKLLAGVRSVAKRGGPIVGVIERPAKEVAPLLTGPCAITPPYRVLDFLLRLKRDPQLPADGLLLCCSRGPEPVIDIRYYDQTGEERVHVQLRPRNASVGRPLLRALGRAVAEAANHYWIP